MKKRDGLFFILIFFIIITLANTNSIDITGDATSGVNMNITVTSTTAGVTITSPKNQTYLNNDSILLSYSVTDGNTIWYNIDNGLVNTTITSSKLFNVSQGSHTLYLYANGSTGTVTTENITFSVNSAKLTIIDNEFETGAAGNTLRRLKKGDSTDFFNYTFEELQDLSSIIFEDTTYGKITFNQAINLTNDEDTTDNQIDLDTHVNISSNRIEINSTALPNFNKSATLRLYGLTFSNPRILKDGVVCPSTICTQQSYSSSTGILIFNVTGFSVYSSEQISDSGVSLSSPGDGSGGSGTGLIPSKQDFDIDIKNIQVSLKQGETKSKEIIIKNTGAKEISIILQIPFQFEELIKIDEQMFILQPDESKKIPIKFTTENNTTPDLYLGRIIVQGGNLARQILISLEVESEKPLFDAAVEISEKYKSIQPGEYLFAEVELFQLREFKLVDVQVEYEIRDYENNIVLKESESIAVETRTTLSKSFFLSDSVSEGEYILYTRVLYNGEIASSSASFEVKKMHLNIEIIHILLAGFTFLLLMVLYLIYEIRKIKKGVKYYKIDEKILVKNKIIK